jgi:hypothetical protein
MCICSINHVASHDVSSSVERNGFYVGKYIIIFLFFVCLFVYDTFLYEVYKFHAQNRGRFFSDHVSSRMFSSNTAGWISIAHFRDSALTRLDFAATVFISCRFTSYTRTWGSTSATDVSFNVEQHPNHLRLCFLKQTPPLNV